MNFNYNVNINVSANSDASSNLFGADSNTLNSVQIVAPTGFRLIESNNEVIQVESVDFIAQNSDRWNIIGFGNFLFPLVYIQNVATRNYMSTSNGGGIGSPVITIGSNGDTSTQWMLMGSSQDVATQTEYAIGSVQTSNIISVPNNSLTSGLQLVLTEPVAAFQNQFVFIN